MINGSGSSKTEVRPVAAFSAVRLSDVGARVVIERTGKESLEVTADDNLVALFTSEVKDGTLYLSAAKGKSMSGKRPLFKVTVSDLRQLGVSGSGSSMRPGSTEKLWRCRLRGRAKSPPRVGLRT